MKKVSIIIPIYNVEKYLRKCVDSVICQTYKNLEIILVDDGSPDSCPEICDSYVDLDSRIKVIHKQNGGLSDARNTGIDMSSGEYITFVDSDDYIENDMIEILISTLEENHCDISTCNNLIVHSDNIVTIAPEQNITRILATENALENLFYKKDISVMATAKLYKKSLFKSIRFPIGKLNEDLATTYKLIAISKKIAVNSAKKYYYLQRHDSIMSSGFSAKRMDSLKFAKEQIVFLEYAYPSIVKSAQSQLFMTAVAILLQLFPDRARYPKFYNECIHSVKKLNKIVVHDSRSSKKQRLQAGVSMISVELFINLLSTYRRFKSGRMT